MHIVCSNISQALSDLRDGESLLVPCNGKTLQSTQSSIGSMLKRRKLDTKQFSQSKAMLLQDEHHLPIPFVVVTRKEGSAVLSAVG